MATLEEIQSYFVTDFHQCDHTVDEIGPRWAVVRQRVGENELRPGGTGGFEEPVAHATATYALPPSERKAPSLALSPTGPA